MNGWLQALANVVAAGALSLAYAVGQRLGSHPIAFVLYALLAASIGMIAIAGASRDARAIARHPLSWAVGVSLILIETSFFVMLAYVSPAHGNLVVRISIPIAILGGWVFLRRPSAPLTTVAAAIITLTTIYVVAITESDARWGLALTGGCTGLFMVTRSFAAEFHPFNRAAKSVREKLQVTGVLVLVTSLLSLAGMALLALATYAGVVPRVAFLPALSDMTHPPTILLGVCAGGALLTMMSYLSFSAVVKIGSANYTAAMAISPAMTWAFQELGTLVGWIVVKRPEPRLVAAMAVLIASVLLIFWAGRNVMPGIGRRAP